jgi:hypothetical protein
MKTWKSGIGFISWKRENMSPQDHSHEQQTHIFYSARPEILFSQIRVQLPEQFILNQPDGGPVRAEHSC